MTYQLVDTIIWIGRVMEVWGPDWCQRMDRANVKMHLCGRTTAKDTHVRQALLARFPQTGGGKTPAVGTKKQPGPLYGVKNDAWAALAVAVTYADQLAGKITVNTRTKRGIDIISRLVAVSDVVIENFAY